MRWNPDSFPLAPRRYPFFYGWFVLVLGSVGFLMSAPGQTYGVSPFTDALIRTLGLTRSQLSLAYMFGTIGSSLCLTGAGRVYDRFGARVVAPAASTLLGLILVLLSQCDRIARGVAQCLGSANLQVVGFVIVLLLFFALRFSGQGVLTMVSNNMRVKWFDRYRGLVIGLSGMVVASAFSSAPAVLNALVEAYGWRGAWLRMAFVVGGAFSAVAVLFFRDNPEACGLQPDGPLARRGTRRNDDAAGAPEAGRAAHRRQFTLAEARRTYSFWVFAAGLGLFAFYITGMSFHAASIFKEAGIERSNGYMVFFYASIISVVLRPFVGWLCDHIPLKYLLMALMIGIFVSTMGLRAFGEGWPMWTVVVGNGLAGATLGSLVSVTWPNLFGREHLGAISGFNMSITVFASAIAPWLFSQSLAWSGNYGWAINGCAIAAVLSFLCAIRADNPQRG